MCEQEALRGGSGHGPRGYIPSQTHLGTWVGWHAGLPLCLPMRSAVVPGTGWGAIPHSSCGQRHGQFSLPEGEEIESPRHPNRRGLESGGLAKDVDDSSPRSECVGLTVMSLMRENSSREVRRSMVNRPASYPSPSPRRQVTSDSDSSPVDGDALPLLRDALLDGDALPHRGNRASLQSNKPAKRVHDQCSLLLTL